MSRDFAVEYGALEQYAEAMESITADAAGVLRAVTVDSTSRSMPGGLASGAASLLQRRWAGAVERATGHMAGHPQNLNANAAAYRDMEDQATGTITEFFQAP